MRLCDRCYFEDACEVQIHFPSIRHQEKETYTADICHDCGEQLVAFLNRKEYPEKDVYLGVLQNAIDTIQGVIDEFPEIGDAIHAYFVSLMTAVRDLEAAKPVPVPKEKNT